ncbi:hypothetical protein BJ508DRAFT_307264 [Ascobolus immersus RN42]|uniref:Uncharacterized protein n=1 Tax=Ascobolus immersus RN42 TaxID=1160509 RepID=A0A3N4I3C5_ASCIM|nr:hypothetical protein BJ508DRAFT_307264 [Ascobolus immersus RN42]
MSTNALIDGAAPAGGVPRQRRPSNFLCLVPVQSASYPTQPVARPLASPTAEAKPVDAVPVQPRSASVSSAVSVGDKQRFLKLGPVFWGGNAEDDDYAVEV